ncbi:Sensor histidine kinase YesM [Paenibacillus sp. UNCCL117]|uniref:hybrid sensor histidine kinase/response regulator n=1 Tax=unclassified Paenibacillus TaxID=185978 RepID=UPI000885930A|nr:MULTISPECIES: ATP-binding protein [unclassified Paenibacillus]SDC44014.1 Sensor histidine kinase YesM [Paenibacillus sp. cl123]SFW12829.1 Sensor histidine kinase YesM [Paenibacillus sp. UNCCL117]
MSKFSCMTWKLTHRLLKYAAIVLVYVSILFGLRLLWFGGSLTQQQPQAAQGILDMRGWDFENSRPISLDGEWELYPGQLMTHEDFKGQLVPSPRLLNVPGDWSSAFPEEPDRSYGYGTYRLRILVDRQLDQPYEFWIRQIQASSEVEINGQQEAAFGKPAAEPDAYEPRVMSYTAIYTNDQSEAIELLIRVANYDHPANGGIVRSIRFGSQASIDTERMYSVGLQLATFLILLLHGLYAGILFIFSHREKTFLVFLLLLVTAGMTIVTDHDYLISIWLPLDYSWALKLRLLSYMWLSFFILWMSRNFSGFYEWKKLYYSYVTILCLYTVFVLAAQPTFIYFTTEARVFSVLYLFPIVWFVILIGKMVLRQKNDALFLLFAASSIASSVLWGAVFHNESAGLTYYPIDVMAAIVGFSAYWFKRYFRHAAENARLNEHLQAADKRKDQFLANTSHELRTPLHGIINLAQTIAAQEGHRMDERNSRNMELLLTISRRMSHMLGDLLDVARLQEQRIVLTREPLLLQSVVSGVFDMLSAATDGKPVELQMDFPASMPPVLADEKRIVQVLFNLLHNAVKFTHEGSVTVSGETEGGQAIIHVADTGVGMDEETLARVFLPYEQGPQNKTGTGGIGLGLSICMQLVELHDGILTARSVPGQGSVFSFTLPLAGESAEQIAAADEESRSTERTESAVAAALAPERVTPVPQQSAAGKLNILAVDDDSINLKVLKGILSDEPYEIHTVLSAQETLELLGTRRWDLLIADVMMPQMSGYELTRIVRERFSLSELPILLLTARSQPEDIYTGFLSGANDYVAKPVDATELIYRVRSLTTLKRSIDESLRMEAAYLQAQIHPHFLFNTLNSIMALSDIDQERMRKLGDSFTAYLRISYDFLNSQRLAPLSHELELVRAYLYIEKERFEERLSVDWQVDPLLDPLIPPLTIQPLVENAVKHGLLSRSRGGNVRIRIEQQADYTILFEVQDDGIGMEDAKIAQLLARDPGRPSGIGLRNTNRRLLQLYGQGLTIRSKPGEGTTVSFVIELQREDAVV